MLAYTKFQSLIELFLWIFGQLFESKIKSYNKFRESKTNKVLQQINATNEWMG